MTKSLISIKSGSKVYVENNISNQVLNDINFQLLENKGVAIMGPSGSGKSTLLNIISMLDSFDTGHYTFDSQLVTNLSQNEKAKILKEQIAIVNQNYELFESLTVRENIELIYNLSNKHVDNSMIKQVLGDLKLANLETSYPHSLSGGEKQRVNIARAICKQPKLLLLDEPTANLDYRTSREITNLLTALEGSKICMTHDPKVASMYDRVFFLQNGQIKYELWQYDNEDTAGYIKRIIEQSLKARAYERV